LSRDDWLLPGGRGAAFGADQWGEGYVIASAPQALAKHLAMQARHHLCAHMFSLRTCTHLAVSRHIGRGQQLAAQLVHQGCVALGGARLGQGFDGSALHGDNTGRRGIVGEGEDTCSYALTCAGQTHQGAARWRASILLHACRLPARARLTSATCCMVRARKHTSGPTRYADSTHHCQPLLLCFSAGGCLSAARCAPRVFAVGS
jgi:hypothetical protein